MRRAVEPAALLALCLLSAQASAGPPGVCDGPLPPLEVANALPSHKAAAGMYDRAKRYVDLMATAHGRGRFPWFQEPPEVVEANEWAGAWALIDAATDPGIDPYSRRLALRKLVRVLGWRAVLTGEVPCPRALRGE